METISTHPYALLPIAPHDADRLRRQGGVSYVADSVPGFPCRQCLRDAELGEEMILVSYDPFDRDSPYRSSSPIFLHREPCEPHDGDAGATLPEQLVVRQLSVRAFDASAMMLDAVIVDGHDLAHTVAELFADPAIERLHVHNAVRGCWAASIVRRQATVDRATSYAE